MPPIGPPPYTHEQISAMTSQAERTRAYAELASYVARLKREKAERQNAETQGDVSNSHSSSPHRKLGGSSHGSAHYHPYQRPQATVKSTVDSRDANHSKQPSNNAAPTCHGRQTEPRKLCPAFTSAGLCTRNACSHIHDPDKQAVCKRWFYKDTCKMGKFCPLSHVATPHNTPTCTYFMAGQCFNKDCHFAHVRVDPTALNCEKFGSIGYCEKGDMCTKLHAHECPYFANLGFCYHGDKCRLGHCHRASRMKASRLPSPASPPASNTPNGSNTPEGDMDAVEADLEQIMPKADAHQQAQFTQQADFVSFDEDP